MSRRQGLASSPRLLLRSPLEGPACRLFTRLASRTSRPGSQRCCTEARTRVAQSSAGHCRLALLLRSRRGAIVLASGSVRLRPNYSFNATVMCRAENPASLSGALTQALGLVAYEIEAHAMADPKGQKLAAYLFFLAGLFTLLGAYTNNQASQYGVGVIFLSVGTVFFRNRS